jgi:hypothetical protein
MEILRGSMATKRLGIEPVNQSYTPPVGSVWQRVHSDIIQLAQKQSPAHKSPAQTSNPIFLVPYSWYHQTSVVYYP